MHPNGLAGQRRPSGHTTLASLRPRRKQPGRVEDEGEFGGDVDERREERIQQANPRQAVHYLVDPLFDLSNERGGALRCIVTCVS